MGDAVLKEEEEKASGGQGEGASKDQGEGGDKGKGQGASSMVPGACGRVIRSCSRTRRLQMRVLRMTRILRILGVPGGRFLNKTPAF